MKNHLASAATLCLLLTCLFAHHRASAQSFALDDVSLGTIYVDSRTPLLNAKIPSALPAAAQSKITGGDLDDAGRWVLALVFSALAVLFGLATLQQVREFW